MKVVMPSNVDAEN